MRHPFRDRDLRPFLLLAALLGVVWLRHHPRERDDGLGEATVAVEQARDLYPEAEALAATEEQGRFAVLDAAGGEIGTLLVSGPDTRRVTGYGGPTPVAIGLDADGEVMGVLVLDNAESEDYFQDVLDSALLESWNGLSPDAARRKPVDAVSGATLSSSAIIETVQLTLQAQAAEAPAVAPSFRATPGRVALGLVLLADLALFFFAKRLHRVRYLILALNVAVTGFWLTDMLSLALLAGWLQHGIPARAWLGIGTVLLLAILLPLCTGRDFYCTCVCPYGSFQDLLGRWHFFQQRAPKWLVSFLGSLRGLLLGLVWLGLVAGATFDLTGAEPFAAFHWRVAGIGTLVLAGVFLLLSLCIPRAWCRYLCPTGRLLRVARCSRSGEGTGGWMSFGTYCVCLLTVAAGWLAWNCAYVPAKTVPDVLQVIHNRRSVRNYTDEPVTPEQVETLLRAGMAAPTAGNTQPWAFVVVTERERLEKLAENLHYGKMLAKAGAAIVVCGVPERALPGAARDMWLLDCTAASQNILLAAEGIGLGAVWVGIHPIPERIALVRQVLDLPETVAPLNIISIGHPLGIEQPKRKYDERKIHRETWRGAQD
ncbi:MAG: nitroreductase family protein [Lentisphaeria bacterium]|jgi:nitroreductase/Na+-translocating ferredoxin:NAD+ oxidoreductase RnfG subunit|nr:nitroreductase family protein [Lentisphaeria bacterium]